MSKTMGKFQTILVTILLILGFLVRLYRIDQPVADWHSFRQADTASVTKNIYLGKGTILVPTYHDFGDVASGKWNPKGYRMVEFPIYNQISATLAKALPFFSLDKTSRLVNISFWIIASLCAWLLFKSKFGATSAFFGLVAYLFLPYGIYYSRVILPDPFALSMMVISIYLYSRDQKIFSSIFFIFSLLAKPYVILISLPLFFFFAKDRNIFKLGFFAFISCLPLLAWRVWILQFPTGVASYDWLLNGGGIRFRPSWFRWLFYERLGLLITGAIPAALLYLGLLKKPLGSLLAWSGILVYFSIIARGNVQHDYYQVLVFFSLCFLLASSFSVLTTVLPYYSSKVLLFFLLLAGIAFSWYNIKGYYQINNSQMIQVAEQLRTLIPSNSILIAPYNGDTAYLYHAGFDGYPIEIYNFPQIIASHPGLPIYLASLSKDNYTHIMQKQFKTIKETDQLVLLDIRQTLSP